MTDRALPSMSEARQRAQPPISDPGGVSEVAERLGKSATSGSNPLKISESSLASRSQAHEEIERLFEYGVGNIYGG